MSLKRELAIAIPIFIVAIIIASQLVVVPTSSMTPTIKVGDMVVVEKNNILGMFNEVNPDNVKVGDVIIYQENSSGVTQDIIHRVIGINNSNGQTYYILKGDNNTVADPSNVYTNQVVGKTVNMGGKPVTIPWVGNLMLWLKGVA